jgi:hypothetical protein
MVSPDEFREFWKEDLVRAQPQALQGISLPAQTREFLLQVGLPREADLLLSFQLDVDQLPQVEAPSGIYCIGTDGATSICIDVNQRATIVSIDPQHQMPTRFLNSGVSQLAECLMIYRKRIGVLSNKDLSDDEAMYLISELVKEIETADQEALQRDDNWLSLIIEQMNTGLL